MNLRIASQSVADVAADWLALPLDEGTKDVPSLGAAAAIGATLRTVLETEEFNGKVAEILPLYGPTGLAARNLILVGLGAEGRDQGAAFSAGVALSKRLGSKPRSSLAVLVPPGLAVSAFVEGLVVGSQGPDLRKSEPSRHAIGEILIVRPEGAEAETFDAEVRRGEIVGEAVNVARRLVNLPPADKAPTVLADIARDLAAENGLEVAVHDAQWLAAERFGGVLGVAAGSDQPPTFVQVAYRHGGDAPTIALVGKGVTFDSGGLSLKPSASMEDMKSDMTGSAVVLATITAVARLGLKVNLTASFAFVENMTGGRAMKLGDVLTHRNGTTVEVMNTDAEGRLVLADILSYVAESQPACIVDLATLTGACMVALGTKIAGLFSTDDRLAAEIAEASKATGERTWRLPLDDDFRDGLKSQVADMKNVAGKWGGASTAAKFLEPFAADVPWLHLDIAGPSWAESDSATRDPGGTGCFVRTLVRWLESRAV